MAPYNGVMTRLFFYLTIQGFCIFAYKNYLCVTFFPKIHLYAIINFLKQWINGPYL